MKIPKDIYFYWAGKEMSFLRFMTFYSFRKFHPEWNIYLYLDDEIINDEPTWENTQDYKHSMLKNYIKYLLKINVIIKEFKLCDKYQFLKEGYPAHRSDLFSYMILSEKGGIYSDTDILFIRNINDFLLEMCNRQFDTALAYLSFLGNKHFPVGFFIGSDSDKSKKMYETLLNKCEENFDKEKYQSLGSELLYKELKSINNITNLIKDINVLNLEKDFVYLYSCLIVNEMWKGLHLPTDRSAGIHWYGGDALSLNFNKIINHKNYSDFNNIICNNIKAILKKYPFSFD